MSTKPSRRRWPRSFGASHALPWIALAGGALGLGCARGERAPATSGPRARLIARIDSLAEFYRAAQKVPGMSIGVLRGADTLVLQGFGFANLEDSVRATAGTVYRIGSITKQFTAAAILRLVEQDRIQLDSPLGAYIGTYIGAGARATIRQVLTHTSGIPNYTALPAFAQLRQADLSDYELLDLFRHRPLDFPPGSRWHYSNSNYYALGLVLQQLGGAPYGDYLAETLLKPLGLTHTVYCGVEPIIPDRAAGYSVASGNIVNASYISMHVPGAAGALCSTIGDLLRWQADLAGGQVVRPATYREMTTPAVLTNGTRTTYGFGFDVDTLHGHQVVEHSGGINGFSADLAYYPADSLSVVVLMNSDAGDAALVARRIAETALGFNRASASRTRCCSRPSMPETPAARPVGTSMPLGNSGL